MIAIKPLEVASEGVQARLQLEGRVMVKGVRLVPAKGNYPSRWTCNVDGLGFSHWVEVPDEIPPGAYDGATFLGEGFGGKAGYTYRPRMLVALKRGAAWVDLLQAAGGEGDGNGKSAPDGAPDAAPKATRR